MIERDVIEYIKKIKAHAQTGLTYSTDPYDIQRYQELSQISDELTQLISDQPIQRINDFYINAKEYPTPKVDVRAVVFDDEGRLLLVKEKADGCWALPGGWADIGISPAENAVKEVQEETGYHVKPTRLLGILDKRNHAHPPCLEYTYKIFIQCEITGGRSTKSFDILEVG